MNRKGTPKNLRSPWKKGEAPNPKGSSKRARERKLWRQFLQEIDPDVQAVFKRAVTDKRIKFETKLSAAKDLADRLHGRPRQEIEGLFGSEGMVVIVKDKDEDF